MRIRFGPFGCVIDAVLLWLVFGAGWQAEVAL